MAPGYANRHERPGLNPGACGFDSHAGHWTKHGSVGNRKTIGAQNLECCGFDSHLGHCPQGRYLPRDATGVAVRPSTGRRWVRSPYGARPNDAVRKPAKRPSSNLGETTVGSTPTRVTDFPGGPVPGGGS